VVISGRCSSPENPSAGLPNGSRILQYAAVTTSGLPTHRAGTSGGHGSATCPIVKRPHNAPDRELHRLLVLISLLVIYCAPVDGAAAFNSPLNFLLCRPGCGFRRLSPLGLGFLDETLA